MSREGAGRCGWGWGGVAIRDRDQGPALRLTSSHLRANYTVCGKGCLRRVRPKYEFHGCFGEENIFIVPLVPFQSIV